MLSRMGFGVEMSRRVGVLPRHDDRGRVVMSTLAHSVSAARGRILIRLEAVHGGIGSRTIAWGQDKTRALTQDEAIDPIALCQAFGLDPHRVIFDLPSSARGVGSTVSGAGGSGRGFRDVSGFVFARGPNGKANGDPIAKVIFLREGMGTRDYDPTDRSEFERL